MSENEDRCPNSPTGLHCRHTALYQHTLMHHRDEVCCHCGQSFCITTLRQQRDPAHGPFV